MTCDHSSLESRTANRIVCRICRTEKPTDCFEADTKMRSGFRSECHECHKASKLLAYHRRKEEIARRRKGLYEAAPALHRAKALETYHRLKERWQERRQRYRKNNLAKSRVWCQSRRSRLAGAPGTHRPEDIRRIYNRQRGLCFWCGIAVGTRYEVDHVIPITRGGANYPENLVIACEWCNASKFNKLPVEWRYAGRIALHRLHPSRSRKRQEAWAAKS